MKACKIAILGLMDDDIHSIVSHMLWEGFETIQSAEALFEPRVYLMPSRSPEDIRDFIKKNKVEDHHLIISVGCHVTKTLKELYTKGKIKKVQTVFIGVTEPLKHGIVKSLHKPGGCISGVRAGLPSAAHHASTLSALKPLCSKILLPYDPIDADGFVEKYTSQLASELERSGFSVTRCPFTTADEAIASVCNQIEEHQAVLLPAMSKIHSIFPAVSYACKLTERVFIASEGDAGGSMGAPFSYGDRSDLLLGPTLDMVKRYWIDRIPVGEQPVFTAPINARLYVNRATLPTAIKPSLLKKLLNTPEFVVIFEWANCPLRIGKERIYERKFA